MDTLLFYLGPVLGCMAMMGVFMYLMGWGMRRSGGRQQAPAEGTDTAREVGALREEVALLRAERAERSGRASA